MYLQDLDSALPVRNSDLDLPVEPARPAQSGINGLFPVGGSDHNHLASLFQAIHHGQELGHHSSLHLPCNLTPLRGNGVDLVYEYDGWSGLLRLLEDLPQPLLALSIVF